MPSNDVQELLDRAAITDTLYRIARAMDSKDWDLLAAGYTEDAQGDYVNAAASGRTEIVEGTRAFLGSLDATHHAVHNIEVSIDGDVATTHATMTAQHVRGGEQFLLGGTYDDTFRRTEQGWQISNRRIRGLWSTGDPAVLTVPVS
ncbi:nuclear transport factor 2 family protein [Catenuloplanes atrovinosus]|uniref:Ketosteroid isomerase-like protein n=1 Tax=Catenuloplanes atrovinosus TaxID=137266 RepID=A0AAE3YM23_9ACTN|nr:nuclear transport factor 2 family protein [Catenuloplanes atrovinosus]MDR7276020.1 ketosteroid isomerase-like protein [Catenuloplanes atrovinosus]